MNLELLKIVVHRVSSVFGHRWKRKKFLGPQKKYVIVGEKVGGWGGGLGGGEKGEMGHQV